MPPSLIGFILSILDTDLIYVDSNFSINRIQRHVVGAGYFDAGFSVSITPILNASYKNNMI